MIKTGLYYASPEGNSSTLIASTLVYHDGNCDIVHFKSTDFLRLFHSITITNIPIVIKCNRVGKPTAIHRYPNHFAIINPIYNMEYLTLVVKMASGNHIIAYDQLGTYHTLTLIDTFRKDINTSICEGDFILISPHARCITHISQYSEGWLKVQ